jgi:hypothetical protein
MRGTYDDESGPVEFRLLDNARDTGSIGLAPLLSNELDQFPGATQCSFHPIAGMFPGCSSTIYSGPETSFLTWWAVLGSNQ